MYSKTMQIIFEILLYISFKKKINQLQNQPHETLNKIKGFHQKKF